MLEIVKYEPEQDSSKYPLFPPLPLNKSLCRQEGDVRNVHVLVVGVGDAPSVNVYQN